MRYLAAFGLWMVASSALAGAPDYDAFSEPDGEIATMRQELAAWSMLRNPEQLESVYADAVKGMPRLREVIFRAFAARARERGLENEAVLAAVNGLLSLEGRCGVEDSIENPLGLFSSRGSLA